MADKRLISLEYRELLQNSQEIGIVGWMVPLPSKRKKRKTYSHVLIPNTCEHYLTEKRVFEDVIKTLERKSLF